MLGYIEILAGDHAAGRAHAREVQRIAKISGDVHREARGLYNEALSVISLGDYRKCITLTRRGRTALSLCGLSHGTLNYVLMGIQAEVHKLKSEYVEAHDIRNQILQATADDNYQQALSLINIADINILTGVPMPQIQSKIDASRAIANTSENMFTLLCDTIQANLNLREGDMSHTLFCKCLQLGWRMDSEIAKEKLGIYKALQFLGDAFLQEEDEVTATSLFTLALEGFTELDVHHSRAECMIRLGDISNRHGNVLKALELWEQARPLFERSSQAKRVQHIDERLVRISEDIKEQHKMNLARLTDLNTSVGTVEELDEDLQEDELENEAARLVAV
ncbi:hypothetical protein B0H16DRAFT_1705555 [Mycena metata]|uniref:Uncharacterized protein n=1 Tax=Mycena metata TaxID=1033252 RepID=A0AAD7DX29_9AGAR|nr:hypothetical protein B0H16DRAFT_1705555 [Mycena metata]